MKPNTKFTLSVKDVELIEQALKYQLGRLSESRLTHVQSTIVPEDKLESVKRIDSEVKEVYNLLGRLHNQKNWYRPKSETYISG